MNMRTTWICRHSPRGLMDGTAAAIVLAGILAGGCTMSGGAGREAAREQARPPGVDYHQIMGEIAADRGISATAAGEFLNAGEGSDDPEFSRRATEFAFDYGFDAYALRAARRWAQLEPDSNQAHLYIARLLLRRNDVPGTTAEAEHALGPRAGREPGDYRSLAEALAEEGNLEGLTRVLTRLAAVSPDVPELRLAIAQAALGSGDPDLALYSARMVINAGDGSIDPDQADIIVSRALLAGGDADAAVGYLRRQVGLRPSLEFELEYAGFLVVAEQPREALVYLEELSGRYGDEPGLRRMSALANLAAGNRQEAWEGFSTLLDDENFADESYYRMAEIAGGEARYDQMLKLLGRIGEGPYYLPAQETIARIAEASGDTQSAFRILDRAAETQPERAFDIARMRAATLERLGRYDEMLAVLDEILRYRPDDVAVLLSRGAQLEKMQQLQPALADMEAARQLFPDSALINNALGYTLANRTRRQDEAYRLVRLALERQPEDPAILDSFGWVLYRRGELAEARSYLQLAHARLPDPEISAHLGEVMWKQGERDAAHELWAEALERSPDSQPLIDTMVRFAP